MVAPVFKVMALAVVTLPLVNVSMPETVGPLVIVVPVELLSVKLTNVVATAPAISGAAPVKDTVFPEFAVNVPVDLVHTPEPVPVTVRVPLGATKVPSAPL